MKKSTSKQSWVGLGILFSILCLTYAPVTTAFDVLSLADCPMGEGSSQAWCSQNCDPGKCATDGTCFYCSGDIRRGSTTTGQQKVPGGQTGPK